ncbi:WUSCHEL-related homeobox 10-like [Oryza brachyantha]|uniref:WUSCHEL-related homeobox 10-like n=1 Tax=Oryza brachyantha TaxID=4533 RepID=UPI001ADA3259|nr:WUSCHEL-related homeobox 10-like [Oryza brachyantha]
MDHHHHLHLHDGAVQASHGGHRGGGGEGGEPARSRWAPKPEQILILESIFNSGMVNPAKDETARIRRLLERFGAVRDANVFYWFQNRRSRSRRRARQLQQACGAAAALHQLPSAAAAAGGGGGGGGGYYHHHDVLGHHHSPPFLMHGGCVVTSATAAPVPPAAASANFLADDLDAGGDDDLFAISRQMALMARGAGAGDDHHYSSYADNDSTQLSYHQPTTGTIQVFINGVAYDVPSGGALDMAGTFGRDAMLVHSSGEVLPVDEHGVLIKSLQMGECYYLVGELIEPCMFVSIN